MTLAIYKITKMFPEEEKFGLTSQMRKAADSVPMNLAEGTNRLNKKYIGTLWEFQEVQQVK